MFINIILYKAVFQQIYLQFLKVAAVTMFYFTCCRTWRRPDRIRVRSTSTLLLWPHGVRVTTTRWPQWRTVTAAAWRPRIVRVHCAWRRADIVRSRDHNTAHAIHMGAGTQAFQVGGRTHGAPNAGMTAWRCTDRARMDDGKASVAWGLWITVLKIIFLLKTHEIISIWYIY